MGFFTTVIEAVSTDGASIGVKMIKGIISVIIVCMMFFGAYFYMHHKNEQISSARKETIQIESQISALVATNDEDQKMIDALRAQQLQSDIARSEMRTRDQIIRNSAAAIQSMIDRTAGMELIPHPVLVRPDLMAKDAPMAPVLAQTMAALMANEKSMRGKL